MVVLIISLLALVGFGVASFISGKTLEGIGAITSALISLIADLKGFFWGSSAGSKDKDAAIHNMLNAPAPIPPAPVVVAPVVAAPVAQEIEIPEGMVKVTQEMLDADPTLAESGVKLGDIIKAPEKQNEP